MKKQSILKMIALITGLCMLSLSLYGCSNPGVGTSDSQPQGSMNDDEQPNKDTEEEKVTITVYTEKSVTYDFAEDLEPEFNKVNPNIDVEFIFTPFDEYDTKLLTMIASNTPPDVSAANIAWSGFGEYYNKDVLMDMTPYIEKTGFDATEVGIPENYMKFFNVDGKQYAIPSHAFVTFLLYNKDMFDEAGLPYPPADYEDESWTWDKMMEYAEKLTNISDNLEDTQYGLSWRWSSEGYEQEPQYFGYDVFPSDIVTNGGFASKSSFNNQGVIDAYQTIADLVVKDKVSPPQEFIQGVGGGDPFYAGKVGMLVYGSWTMARFSDLGFRVGVAAVPQNGNSDVRSVLWICAWQMMKGCKNPDAAFEWIRFYSQPEIQKKSVELGQGIQPANVNALDEFLNYFDVDIEETRKVIEGSIQYGHIGYANLMVGSSEINTIVANELNPVLTGEKKAEEVVTGIEEKVDEILSKIAENRK